MNSNDQNTDLDFTPEAMSRKTPAQLADILEQLLHAQLELMQAGQDEAALIATEETQPLTEYIARRNILSDPAMAQQVNRIKKLYTEIAIAVNASKTGVLAQIGKLRRGKKSLTAYRSSATGFAQTTGSNA